MSCWRGSLTTAPEGDPGPDDWLLFLDADVRVTPQALRWALADAIGHGADLLTLAPRLRCGCLAEWLVQPIIVSLLLLLVHVGAAAPSRGGTRPTPQRQPRRRVSERQ